MIQMKNKLIVLITFLLIIYSCSHFASNKQAVISKNDITEQKKVADSVLSPKEQYQRVVLEAPDDIYQFLSNQLSIEGAPKICSNFKDKILEINITVTDTIIIEGTVRIYKFDDNGNLASYEDGAKEVVDFFLNKDARNFKFIDAYKLSYYNFRIEINKLCD